MIRLNKQDQPQRVEWKMLRNGGKAWDGFKVVIKVLLPDYDIEEGTLTVGTTEKDRAYLKLERFPGEVEQGIFPISVDCGGYR